MFGPVTGGRGARSRVRSDHGQATVELALVLPLVFGMLIFLFQIAVVARDDILVVHAARDAAREATVTGNQALVAAAAHRTLPGAAVTITRRGGVAAPVEVAVSFVARTDLPIVGALLPDVTLHGRAVMRVERP